MKVNSQLSYRFSSNGHSRRGGSRGTQQRSFNQIYKTIVGNPYIHAKNIYAKAAIYPRTPVWNFKNDAIAQK